MQWDILFFFNSVLLGVALPWMRFPCLWPTDSTSPACPGRRMLGIAGVFAAFQALMPMTGWICVHTIVQYFRAFEKLIPWIALALLGFIGGKMLIEGIRGGGGDDDAAPRLGLAPCWCRGWPRPSTPCPWASPSPSMTGSWPWSVP